MNARFYISFLFLFEVVSAFSCQRKDAVGIAGTEDIKATKVEIDQLVDNRAAWINKAVELEGFLSYQFEDVAIYPSRRDYEQGNKNKAVWVNLDKRLKDKMNLELFAYKRIRVKGYFSVSQGHLMQYVGTVEDVYFIE